MKNLLWIASCIIILVGCKKDEDKTTTPVNQLDDLIATEPQVKLNPHGRTPLSAEVTFNTSKAATISIEVKGATPIKHTFNENGKSHSIAIHGLYADTTNMVLLTATDAGNNFETDTLYIKTDPLPEFLPDITINTINTSLMEPGMHLSRLHLANHGDFTTSPIIFDNEGNIRWVLTMDDTHFPIQRFKNGNFFMPAYSSILEYSMLGELVKTYAIPGYHAHHEIRELPNGDLLVAVIKEGTTINNGTSVVESVDDHIIVVNRASANIEKEWDLRQVLDVDRHDLTNGDGDWLHMNAMWYDETDNSLVISGRNQGIIKVDWDNNLKWIMAPHKGWGKAGENGDGFETAPYLLTAVDNNNMPYDTSIQNGSTNDASFDWPWGQHAPEILDNGDILIFDNGFNRHYGASSNYSRAVIYSVNENNNTVSQKWAYGEARGSETYSMIISDVDYMPNTGNVLFMPGVVGPLPNYAKIIEVAPTTNDVVFESTINFKNTNGNGSFGWGEMDIVYRSSRINLYP